MTTRGNEAILKRSDGTRTPACENRLSTRLVPWYVKGVPHVGRPDIRDACPHPHGELFRGTGLVRVTNEVV